MGTEAGIAVLPQPGAPEIGREFTLWIVNQTGEDVTQADLTIDIPAKYLEGAEAESFSDDYEVILDTAAVAKGQAKITIRKKVVVQSLAAADYDYDYASELGYLIIHIPEDAANDDSFAYTVSRGEYTTMDKDGVTNKNSFSGTEQRIALSADYQLTCSQAVAGLATTITVTDKSGQPVAMANVKRKTADGEALLGRTNLKGQVTYTFSDAGEQTLHAEVKDKGRSWDLRLVVCQQTTLAEGEKVFGILTNGTQAPETSQSISWISAIKTSAAAAKVKYSEKADLSGAVPAEGTSRIVTFVQSTSGDALRVNQVTLSGLAAGKTYYFQVGDGTADGWSEIRTFRTADASAESTDFFILGDIQSSGDTSKLSSVLDKLKASPFDFAIQTGDAIDNVTAFQSNWWPFLNTMNAGSLGGTDLIHALGNHEYYGDAEGSISGAVYDLPQSAQNGWYTMDYGKVSVTVINHGTDMASALREIAETMDTDCIWKVLVSHEPIYGTNPDSGEPSAEILSLIEKAGFDFVFGGDDHAYARTKPMLSGSETDDVRRGVVYYVCGDLSAKTNNFAKRDCYAVAVPHVEYEGLYLTAQATDERITVIAYDWQGVEIDRYTKERTDCELGRHTVDSTSLYRMSDHTLQCTLCGSFAPVPASASGLYSTTDGGTVILAEGKAKTNEFTQMGDTVYHSCQTGYAYVAAVKDPVTCVRGGRKTYVCETCQASQTIGDWIMPNGHDWDENHVCRTCGFHGIDINTLEAGFIVSNVERPVAGADPYVPTYYYQAGGVRPSSYIKSSAGTRLTWSNDDNVNSDGTMRDLHVSWSNDRTVGKAVINFVGRGNYYGERSLVYKILPNNVENLRASEIGSTSVTLTWSAAAGADFYRLYQCSADGSRILKTINSNVTGTSYTISGLTAETQYYFKMADSANTNDGIYNCPKWSAILSVKTAPMGDASVVVTNIRTTVGGQPLDLYSGDAGHYIFLPANAAVNALQVQFQVTEGYEDAIVLYGDRSEVSFDGAYTGFIDLNALATQNNDGSYELYVKAGEYRAMTVTVMRASSIPTVYLNSDDPSQGRTWVDASKSNHATGTMQMITAVGDSIYDGALSQIKARGNSTFAHYPKKAYQIKLSAASDLLGTGEQVKTWVLLANYGDATMMHDQFFKELAAEMGMDYVASTGWVNLYYDGEYRGVYLLTEKNHIGTDAINITDLEAAYEDANEGYGENMTTATGVNRFGQAIAYTEDLTDPADITGGYMIELNHQMWDEVSGFKTAQGVAFNVKSPEWLSEDAVRYISEYYQEFENAAYAADKSGYNAETGLYYYDYVDADSLVKMFVLQELGLNPDGFVSSLYFYKDVNGKMYVGPIWDQDMTLGTGWTKYLAPDQNYTYHYLAEALIQIPDFQERVRNYYAEFAAKVEKMENLIDDKLDTLTDSAAMNYILWDLIRVGDPQASGHIWNNVNYTDTVRDMKRWITTRMATLEKALAGSSYDSGDANMDGVLDAFDAVDILRYLAGYDNDSFSSQYADFNGDGKVDAFDAVDILRYLAGYRD